MPTNTPKKEARTSSHSFVLILVQTHRKPENATIKVKSATPANWNLVLKKLIRKFCSIRFTSFVVATFLGSALLGSALSCKSGKAPTETSQTLNFSQSRVYHLDFCNLKTSEPAKHGEDQHKPEGLIERSDLEIWGYDKVQEMTGDLTCKLLKSAPFQLGAAYAHAYQNMTRRRDKARCPVGHFPPHPKEDESSYAGKLLDDDPLSTAINNLLANHMTRSFVSESSQCPEASKVPAYGFCKLQASGLFQGSNTMDAAMATTFAYLSTNIALSLSAILLDDLFWKKWLGDEAKNYRLRIEKVQRYKPLFDRFNRFLAETTKNVAMDLHAGGFLKNNFITHSAKILGAMKNLTSAAYAGVRSDAFRVGIDLAESFFKDRVPAERIAFTHPLVKVHPSGFLTASYGESLDQFRKVPGHFWFTEKLELLENRTKKKSGGFVSKAIWSISGKTRDRIIDLKCPLDSK